jgi:uncharacterized protein
LTHAVVPRFVERGSGTIINIASVAVIAPDLLNDVYAGTKAFVLAFSESLQHELGKNGLRIQVVLPARTKTCSDSNADAQVGETADKYAAGVMSIEDLVDAALDGLDRGDFVTLPSLPENQAQRACEAAKVKIVSEIESTTAAEPRNSKPASA